MNLYRYSKDCAPNSEPQPQPRSRNAAAAALAAGDPGDLAEIGAVCLITAALAAGDPGDFLARCLKFISLGLKELICSS